MSGSKPIGGSSGGLSAIADQRFLGNYSGASAAPQAVQLIAGANITFSATTTSLTITASTGTGSGITSLIAGAGLSGGTITSSGTIAVIMPPIPQGRLTLTSGVPVMTASVTGSTTIYYTPYVGSYVPLYDGTNYVPTVFAELSQATTDATKSPAAAANNSNYDMFVWTDTGTVRCTRGPLWTSDTGRGTGAGTTELVRVAGILLNAVNITNGPAAQRGTYVGSVRTNGSAAADMIYGGTGAAGGESCNLAVWNAYNRVVTQFINFDNTDTWNYTTASFRLKNAAASTTANRVTIIVGLQEDALVAINSATSLNSTGTAARIISVGLNSTTTIAAGAAANQMTGANSINQSVAAQLVCQAPLGFNFVAPIELSSATGTSTWVGDGGGTTNKSLFTVTIPA